MIYLDNASTTKIFPEILGKIEKWSEEFYANPNSVHPEGQKCRREIEKARDFLCKITGCKREDIIFTSCATESNNTIIKGLAEKYPEKNEIVLSPIEHKSVLNPVKYLIRKGFKVKFLKIDKNGIVDTDDLRKKISKSTLFVGVIHVNNETGVIQDVKEIGKVCREMEVFFFSDTVQSFGKVDIPFELIDFFSISGHKINAPKGVGIMKKSSDLVPLLHGGGQEFGIRSGTENTAGILALKEASEIWLNRKDIFIKKTIGLEKLLINKLKENIPEVKIVSENKKVPYITTVIFPEVKGHDMVIALGREGIAVSSGSACSSGSPLPSHVLTGYGYSEEEALSGVRFSFGWDTTEEDISIAVEKSTDIYKKLKRFTGFSL
ncbi:cysteine desulfurase [Persephonella hydrogeniphila]|uniref:cysteine desulfurase n=1 Tax=Persephonella hydrogeniphila TaxID=198703 RepID=A0A285NIX1_9AQUI|nr:cysteine desulfurase family protein [Persephonella hydrogeniphila]SNZ09454.1 cysteine desulfurase [Persephonella hydrogeniphila]